MTNICCQIYSINDEYLIVKTNSINDKYLMSKQ